MTAPLTITIEGPAAEVRRMLAVAGYRPQLHQDILSVLDRQFAVTGVDEEKVGQFVEYGDGVWIARATLIELLPITVLAEAAP